MIVRFRRTKAVLPGLRLGVSWSPKRGLGLTGRVGPEHVGASYSTKKGAYVGGALPGTGLSVGTYMGGPTLPVGPFAVQAEPRKSRAPERPAVAQPAATADPQPERRPPPFRRDLVIFLALLIAAAIAIAALTGPAAAQTCRTYGTTHGADSSCDDGTRARSYAGSFGSTTYVTRPDGERQTCRTYRTTAGATTTCH